MGEHFHPPFTLVPPQTVLHLAKNCLWGPWNQVVPSSLIGSFGYLPKGEMASPTLRETLLPLTLNAQKQEETKNTATLLWVGSVG